jgi:hypothetical protein
MQNPLDAHGLDHGFFQFPRPTVRHFIGYFIAGAMFLFAFSLYSSSLDIPDVPRVDEATQLPSLLEDHAVYDYGPLQQGYESGNYASNAAFVIVPLELESGTIAYDNCRYVEDDEGGGSWEYSFDMDYANQLTFVDKDENRIIAAFAYDGSLDPEGEVDQPSCGSSWSRTIEGFGENDPANYLFNVYLLVEEDPERFQVLSVVEISSFYSQTPPQEVTQREDRGRWSLLALGVGGLVFMYSTTPSLKYDLGRIRKENGNLTKDITSSAGVLGSSGRYFQHIGTNYEILSTPHYPVRAAESDWLFGAPPLPTSYATPYAQDGDGGLLREHPKKMGTPKPATMTPYSIGAIIFSGSFIWLSADLRARDGSTWHTILGWGMTVFVTLVNLIWFIFAWRQFKLVRLVNDLPTSPIRSVAVGQAELVGQVRPSIAGTPEMTVGGRSHKGLVLWQWSSYKYECHTDSDGDTHCSWSHIETQGGGVPFMIHDGSGGMIVDPSLWEKSKKKFDLGSILDTWQRGDWKWEVRGLGIGDPVYILGDCVPRTQDHKEQWGTDPVLPNALLTVVPSTDTGDASVLHYGTEIDMIANNRSIFEILIVPMLVFLFGVFMFLNYTP